MNMYIYYICPWLYVVICRLESAAKGMIDAFKHAKTGSTWIATQDLPVRDITDNITRAYQIMGEFNEG